MLVSSSEQLPFEIETNDFHVSGTIKDNIKVQDYAHTPWFRDTSLFLTSSRSQLPNYLLRNNFGYDQNSSEARPQDNSCTLNLKGPASHNRGARSSMHLSDYLNNRYNDMVRVQTRTGTNFGDELDDLLRKERHFLVSNHIHGMPQVTDNYVLDFDDAYEEDIDNYDDEKAFVYSKSTDVEPEPIDILDWKILFSSLPRFPVEMSYDYTYIMACMGDQQIKLYSLKQSESDPYQIKGSIFVKNLDFEKHIEIKFTFNCWVDVHYVNATYNKSVTPGIDKFVFAIDLYSFKYMLQMKGLINTKNPKLNIQLCCRYDVNGVTYYDNHNYDNYRLTILCITHVDDKLPLNYTSGVANSGYNGPDGNTQRTNFSESDLMGEIVDYEPMSKSANHTEPRVSSLLVGGYEAFYKS